MAQSTKEKTIEFIKTLPDNVSMEEIMYHLYIKETVDERMKEIENGKVIPLKDSVAQEQIEEWLK